MYKKLTSENFKQLLGLPTDYAVEAFLSYGGWGPEVHLERIRKTLVKLSIPNELKQLSGFLNSIYEIKVDNKNYWFAVVYGNTLLSEYTHLACIFGSKKNIHLGSCGGLNEDLNSANLIIPVYSYGNESTTRMYEKDDTKNIHYPNKELGESLEQKISKDFSVHHGPIMTIQAMLAETEEDIQTWSKDGYYGVEMETSTIFAISNHFKVPSTALLFVSDNLIKGQTVNDESHRNEKIGRDNVQDEMFRVVISELY